MGLADLVNVGLHVRLNLVSGHVGSTAAYPSLTAAWRLSPIWVIFGLRYSTTVLPMANIRRKDNGRWQVSWLEVHTDHNFSRSKTIDDETEARQFLDLVRAADSRHPRATVLAEHGLIDLAEDINPAWVHNIYTIVFDEVFPTDRRMALLRHFMKDF